MIFSVDPASPVSLSEQIARQVRLGFAGGALARGERLPPARELAAALEVNMHTVLRAYQDLRDEGLIELRQGRGASIRKDVIPVDQRAAAIAAEARAAAARHGIPVADIVRALQQP